MNNEKYKTTNDDLFFIGKDDCEEYYLEFKDDDVRGWTFMGLRPETESYLREMRRETEPEDIGIDIKACGNWFDYQQFADDMENEWYEWHDVQAEREDESGETFYLGFGSGSDIFYFFKEHKIKSYKSYLKCFTEDVGLDEKTFKELMILIKQGQDKDSSKMTNEERLIEKKAIKSILLPEDYGTCPAGHKVDVFGRCACCNKDAYGV